MSRFYIIFLVLGRKQFLLVAYCLPQTIDRAFTRSFIPTCRYITPFLFLGHFDPHSRRHLVVFHPHYNIVVYGKFGRFPYSGTDDYPHRECPGSGGPNGNRLWNSRRRQHDDLFSGNSFSFFCFFFFIFRNGRLSVLSAVFYVPVPVQLIQNF